MSWKALLHSHLGLILVYSAFGITTVGIFTFISI